MAGVDRAEETMSALEGKIKELDRWILSSRRARKTLTLTAQGLAEADVEAVVAQRSLLRQSLEDTSSDIRQRKDGLIRTVETAAESLKQSPEISALFTIRWTCCRFTGAGY
jgi:hypothetical protein